MTSLPEKKEEIPSNNNKITKLSTLDIDTLISNVLKCQTIPLKQLQQICSTAKPILTKQPNMVAITPPITICGDIHGQFYDLIELFNIGGYLPETNYLFLGDYVDRGYYSVECITLLLLYKIRYNNRVTILRGNHESRGISQIYGFYDECMKKYGNILAWQELTNLFDYLPITANISSTIICMHGGISPELKQLSNINNIDRVQEIPHEGLMCDILWSDPITHTSNDDETINDKGWYISPRGCSYNWSEKISKWFNNKNKLNTIIRAHQLVMNGYNWCHNNNVLTIFSAPNYCYRCGNQGAIMEINEYFEYTFLQYDDAPR